MREPGIVAIPHIPALGFASPITAEAPLSRPPARMNRLVTQLSDFGLRSPASPYGGKIVHGSNWNFKSSFQNVKEPWRLKPESQ
jgi:hypothetical protein